jgi:hypothetical protein
MKLYSPAVDNQHGATVQRGNHSNACSRFDTLWRTQGCAERRTDRENGARCFVFRIVFNWSIGAKSAAYCPTLPTATH